MCSTSLDPKPSMISRPEICFQALKTSAASISAAETHRRRLDKSAVVAAVGLAQGRVERRQSEEHRRTIARDRLENGRRLGLSGQ